MGRYRDRASYGSQPASAASYPAYGADLELYPTLAEFLAANTWDDGTERVLGTVRILVENGRLKACLNDNAAGRYAFVSLQSLDTILRDLEGILAGDEIDWRFSQRPGGKR